MKTLFAISLALVAAAVRSAEPVGQTISLQGTVSIQTPQAPVRPLAVKGGVFMQDVIRTAAESKTQVLFADDTVFSQGPNMEVMIDEFVYDPAAAKNNAFKARVERGVFRVVTGKITDLNPDKFEIKTGRATIGIRGCGVSARMDDRRDEITIDYVRTGRVVVVTPHGGQAVEFHEPGLLVIEDGGRVRKQRFDAARFVLNLGDTTPHDTGRGGGPELPGGNGGFRRDAGLIQTEVLSFTQTDTTPAPSPRKGHHAPPPQPPPPPVVIAGTFNGFAMNQWQTMMSINPLDMGAADPLHATENMSLDLNSELANPASPGGKLYDFPLSVMIIPAQHMPVFGSQDPNSVSITSTRLDAETFEALLTGQDYDITMRIRRASPDSDWFTAWWGVDSDTPSRLREYNNVWTPCQGFAVLGNTYTAAETLSLKNGATVFNLVQDGANWAGGLGQFQFYPNSGQPTASPFILAGSPAGAKVQIGGGQDSWSTQLRLQSTAASPTPALCDVRVTGSLLDANQKFTAVVSPVVNTLTIGGRDFRNATPQAFGTARLVGGKETGKPPTGFIGSVALSGFIYDPNQGSGSYKMNLHFGTDLKPASP